VRDVAGLALNDELHGTLARSAGRKVLATNDDSVMIGSVFLMYHAVDAGNGSHLAGKVGATKASGRSGGTHAALRFAKNESTVARCSDGREPCRTTTCTGEKFSRCKGCAAAHSSLNFSDALLPYRWIQTSAFACTRFLIRKHGRSPAKPTRRVFGPSKRNYMVQEGPGLLYALFSPNAFATYWSLHFTEQK
jgi:hypothetical protein